MNETDTSVDTRPNEEDFVWHIWTGIDPGSAELPDPSGPWYGPGARIYLSPPSAAILTAVIHAGNSEVPQFPSPHVFLSRRLLDVAPNLITETSIQLPGGTLYGNAPDADTSDEVVPRELKREVVSAVRRKVQASGLPFHVRSVVEVDHESGWRELLIEVTVDAAPETRDELWSRLCDALDDQVRTWPQSKRHYGSLIGITVRPTSRQANV